MGLDVNITTSCVQGVGTNYQGTMNATPEGVTCQRWDSQFPHNHSFLPEHFKCKWVLLLYDFIRRARFVRICPVLQLKSLKGEQWSFASLTTASVVMSVVISFAAFVCVPETLLRTTAVTPMVQIIHGASLQTPNRGSPNAPTFQDVTQRQREKQVKSFKL